MSFWLLRALLAGSQGPGTHGRIVRKVTRGFEVFSLVVAAFLGPALLLGAAGGKWGSGVSAVFLAICCTATQVFPYHCSEIMGGQPPGIDILLGGSLLTAILWGLILYLPSASSKPAGEPTTEGKVS